MTQQHQTLDGHGQKLAAQPEPLMTGKKRKHHDFTGGDVAEAVAHQRPLVLSDESQQLASCNLSRPRSLRDPEFCETNRRHRVLARATPDIDARGNVLRDCVSEA